MTKRRARERTGGEPAPACNDYRLTQPGYMNGSSPTLSASRTAQVRL